MCEKPTGSLVNYGRATRVMEDVGASSVGSSSCAF